jgi:hypothetical protein
MSLEKCLTNVCKSLKEILRCLISVASNVYVADMGADNICFCSHLRLLERLVC